MKNTLKLVAIFIPFILFTISCSKNDDLSIPAELQVNDFVWKGLNQFYLWQPDAPNLRDDRFGNQGDLNTFLKTYNDPTNLFNALRIDPNIDRFSVIFSDYNTLEGILSGTTKNNGVDYGLKYKTSNSTDIFGWVKYIIPNSDASTKNIQRGKIFYAINGTPLTASNYKSLLANDTYIMNFADFDNGNITPNGQSVMLTKTTLSENPVLINTVINQGAKRIGYLVYNGFYPNFESQLNTAFANLKAQNATHLILDLRYNSGGSIATASRLASMITGQFNGQIFARQQWNPKMQVYWSNNNASQFDTRFTTTLSDGTGINSLNLSKVIVLTTKSTASASELVINGLKPYVQVIQIGDVTVGKNVGSITVYDSPNFGSAGRNPNHKYAMQPIVLKTVNASGFGDYQTGLVPTTLQVEDLGNLGILGDVTEPLLQTALNYIQANGRMQPHQPEHIFEQCKDAKDLEPLQNEMYLELK